jgi:hypothetical protein
VKGFIPDKIHRHGTGKDIPNMQNLQAVLDLLRQVLDVLAVLGRQQHRLDAGTEGADQLLLDPADGRDASAQGNLTL